MKTIICYYSRHLGNTLRVLEAMTEGEEVELFDVTSRMAVELSQFDRVGLASGIYGGSFHHCVTDFVRQYLPQGKEVFLVATSASGLGGPGRELKRVLEEKRAKVLGSFLCQAMTTFGPFGRVGGFPKNRPHERDFARAREFYRALPRPEGGENGRGS